MTQESNKLLSLLSRQPAKNSHKGGQKSGSRDHYEPVDRFWQYNTQSGQYTYRVPIVYVQVTSSTVFRVPREILSPRYNPLLKGEVGPTMQLGSKHRLRKGRTPEEVIALQEASGDERGATVNRQILALDPKKRQQK